MNFYVWCEIVCRDCADTLPGQHTTGAIPRMSFKREAKARKWKLVGEDWVCNRCLKREGTENEKLAF